jgi:hypothetical protein
MGEIRFHWWRLTHTDDTMGTMVKRRSGTALGRRKKSTQA